MGGLKNIGLVCLNYALSASLTTIFFSNNIELITLTVQYYSPSPLVSFDIFSHSPERLGDLESWPPGRMIYYLRYESLQLVQQGHFVKLTKQPTKYHWKDAKRI